MDFNIGLSTFREGLSQHRSLHLLNSRLESVLI